MDNVKTFDTNIDSFKEIHINIEDAHFTLLTDHGIDKLGTNKKANLHPLHFHSYYEIFYVRDGSLELKTEHSTTELQKDNLIILPPQLTHNTVLKSETSSRYCISFFVQKNNLNSEHSLYDTIVDILSEKYFYIENAIAVYESIKKVCENIRYANHFKISCYFYEFVLELLSISGHLNPTSPEELFSDSSISRTYKIQQIISSHYMKDISLDFIAKKLYLSTRQVNRIVQSFYGCTYREIIARTRIRTAAELLRTSSMTVSDIAAQVGYKSLRGFYSAFKKQYGSLPTEYRKNII